MDNNGTRVAGAILVVIGAIMLAVRFLGLAFDWSVFWPILAFILPSVGFHIAWATSRNWPVLIPGGILLTYGILFLYSAATGYQSMGELWPIFIAGPGVGQLEAALLGGQRQLLIPALTLLVIAGVALSFTLGGGALFLGAALVLLGILLLFRKH